MPGDDFLGILCCPRCRVDLELKVYSGDEGDIIKGLLLCSACGARYPIEDGLIYLLPSIGALKDEGKPMWDLQAFDHAYKRVGYYESSYEWRERGGIPKAITDYDYPKVKGRLLDWLKPKNGDLILDVGTGSGYFIFEMMGKYPYVRTQFVGLDVSREHVRWLAYRRKKENRRNILAVVGDAIRLPFKDNTFDIVTCTEMLEHIYDPKKAIDEIARVLKRRGRALFSTPSKLAWSFWSKIFYLPCHFLRKKNSFIPYDYPLTPNQFIKHLKSENFGIKRFELNVILPPQGLFSLKQPWHIPKALMPTVLNICSQLEGKRASWFRGFALHMLIDASKT